MHNNSNPRALSLPDAPGKAMINTCPGSQIAQVHAQERGDGKEHAAPLYLLP